MRRSHVSVLLGCFLCAFASVAVAQPATTDPAMDRAVALALVARAEVLLDSGDPASAKQLAGEALARSRDPQVEPRAQAVITQAARDLLGPARPRPIEDHSNDILPPEDLGHPRELEPVVELPRVPQERASAATLSVYGSFIGGIIGAPLMAGMTYEPLAAIPGALGGLFVGAVGGYVVSRNSALSERRARLIGSGGTWGAIAGGLFADVATGTDGTAAGDLAIGAFLGGVAGIGAGHVLGTSTSLTNGDVALMDAFASEGALTALALAVVISPPEIEGYSLNGALGAAGGWIIGALAGPNLDASPGRVVRMELAALGGMAAPWLAYPLIADDATNDDEQTLAFLSIVGIVTGTYLGHRWTRDFAGEDARRERSDAPAALLRRSSRGAWSLGASLPHPGRSSLALTPIAPSTSLVLDLAAGRF